MSVSNDPEHFFQTTASLETLAKRRNKAGNKNGDPLVLPSKILTFCLDPTTLNNGLPRLFTAESGGLARRINLEVPPKVALVMIRQGVLDILFVGIRVLLLLLRLTRAHCIRVHGTRASNFGILKYYSSNSG